MGNGGRTAGSWSHLPSGSRELVFWARVLWTLAHETVVPTFRLGLSTSVHFFLETPSLTRSEVCFRGDFRSSQVDDEEEIIPVFSITTVYRQQSRRSLFSTLAPVAFF